MKPARVSKPEVAALLVPVRAGAREAQQTALTNKTAAAKRSPRPPSFAPSCSALAVPRPMR